MDADFGPFFIKFASYFPYNAKLCLNGHEWAKRQASRAGIGFTALDNGFASCDDPAALQRVCDRLSAAKIDALVRKWLRILPHPFTRPDRAAGYRYDVSASIRGRAEIGALVLGAVTRKVPTGLGPERGGTFGASISRLVPGHGAVR